MVEHTVSDLMIDSGIRMESPDGSPLSEQLMANVNGSMASPNGDHGKDVTGSNTTDNTFDPMLESQKTFQKLLGG
uniref:Uncharacterized protein n=1 Tax=Panagrolaimus superbus TaxID=310955 RepID=A0A914ZD94_9BILA